MGPDKCKGGATSGRSETSNPQKPSYAPNQRENLILKDNQKNKPSNSMVPKVAETGQLI